MKEIDICGKPLAEANAAFLAKYPTDDAQIDYYTGLAMAIFREFQIDGRFKTVGVRKNVEEWYKNKKKQMELFRNHPYWNEEAKAIIFTQTETREISYSNAREMLAKLYLYIENKYSNISLTFLAAIHHSLDKLSNSDYETAEINAEFLKSICHYMGRSKIPEKIKPMLSEGTKISKLVYKFCTMIPKTRGTDIVDATKLVDSHEAGDRNYQSFDKYYAKFSDCLSELSVKKLTIISLHFCDFMTMSNGNSWSSCHFINSHNIFHESSTQSYEGSYKQGCLSYALDEPSFLLYTLPDTYEGNEYHRVQKMTRMCCQYKDGILITGKCYPDNNRKTIDHYRQILQMVISGTEQIANLWTFSRDVNKVSTFLRTHDKAAHYPDYLYEKQQPTISIRRNSMFDLDNPMTIGNQAYCVCCGRNLDSGHREWLQCSDHRKQGICKHCGRVLDDDDEGIEILGNIFCKDCVFLCDHHNRYELLDNKHGTIKTNRGEITVCKEAFENYKKCQNCDTYLMYSDRKCGKCGRDNPIKIYIEKCSRYDVGDYVLMGSEEDIEDCDYGYNDSMGTYYPNRIVKITDTHPYRVSALDREDWSWSSDCFAGKVIGADDSMIGLKLSDIM
jgi:hypothetical protein